ncbi:MAG: DeoR/GlpR family DNA-binding transcription regulator [Eubacteriales bacterium]
MNERKIQILNDISANDKITVAELASKFNVSQVTIRSDLKMLESKGLIKRIHGGASSLSDERLDSRLNANYEIKMRIAECAAQMVEYGETIIIESGSTNALLARKLAETKDVTIVTNSYFIANFVRDFPRIKIVLLGGDCQPDSEVCVGPLTRQDLQSFYVDKLFIGTDGFSEEEGFTCNNMQRAEIASAMAKRAQKTIILTDSSKFFVRGVARQLQLSDVSMVITDEGIPETARDLITGSKIELIAVPNQTC